MGDVYDIFRTHLESPAKDAFAISGNDSTDLAKSTRSIYVGGSGNIKLTTIDGSTVTFNSAIAGSILPIRAKRIFSTGTTATNLIGLL
ncbi:hypothetical protein OAA38_00215 [bacterium]|nr:hypothetical protein [bacterium]